MDRRFLLREDGAYPVGILHQVTAPSATVSSSAAGRRGSAATTVSRTSPATTCTPFCSPPSTPTLPAPVVLHKTSSFTSAETDGFRRAADERFLDTLEMSWITGSVGARHQGLHYGRPPARQVPTTVLRHRPVMPRAASPLGSRMASTVRTAIWRGLQGHQAEGAPPPRVTGCSLERRPRAGDRRPPCAAGACVHGYPSVDTGGAGQPRTGHARVVGLRELPVVHQTVSH
jgi:hypothetical protein